MKAQTIFLTTIFILLIFNVFLWLANISNFIKDLLGGVIGLIVAAAATVVLGGLNIFGSGLTSSSVRILFGIITLCMILFQIPISTLPVGLGLANNLLECFAMGGSVFNVFGFIIALALSFMALISGILIIVGGSMGD